MEDLTRLGILLPRFIWELVTAIICGGLIGLERGFRRKAPGLRGYILICFGAALYMMIADLILIGLGETGTTDPARIAAQVVTAIGFIGAGVIIARRDDASGITAAAAVWVTAGVGLVIGTGYPLLGLLVTGALIVALSLLHGIEERLTHKPQPLLLKLIVREDNPELRQSLKTVLEREGVRPDTFRAEVVPNGVKITISASAGPEDVRVLTAALWTTPGVVDVEH